ncbi:MAG: SpoIIE family protein phosphatase [Flavobacteriales bacterium]|jgi:serine phosphatase RsbU (regulator of sigma subunit)|nr:SpoIIE family protein phosphatase [Flavobacteriales bacterium]
MKKLEHIFEAPLLKELQSFPVRHFKKGTVLIHEFSPVTAIPLLMEGTIEVTQTNHKQIETHIYDICPGQSCILSLIAGQNNQLSVGSGTVKDDCTVILVPPTITKKWFDQYSSWRNYIAELYNDRLNELIHNRNLVHEQTLQIQSQKEEITDNITYAKKVQNTLLQSTEQFILNVPNSCVLMQPRDILSGDFFWSRRLNDQLFFAVADCTGHGVSGAMISIVCYQALDEVIQQEPTLELGELLGLVRMRVQRLFETENAYHSEGMDISLCSMKIGSTTLAYSGANNSIYRITKNSKTSVELEKAFYDDQHLLLEYKADRQTIGKTSTPLPFTTQYISFEKGDSFYLTSDGLQDQFGGEKGKKLTKRRMKTMFLNCEKHLLKDRVTYLTNQLKKWQGEERQTDDILVVGIQTDI